MASRAVIAAKNSHSAGDPSTVHPPWVRNGGWRGSPLQFLCLKNPMVKDAGWQKSIGLQRIDYNWSNLACARLVALQGFNHEKWRQKWKIQISKEDSAIVQEKWWMFLVVWKPCGVGILGWIRDDCEKRSWLSVGYKKNETGQKKVPRTIRAET